MPSETGITSILGVEKQSNKGIAGGYAGLDAGSDVDILQMRPFVDYYSNHLGAVDNFTETIVSGTGSATTDATNHMMGLNSGTGAGSHYAIWQTKRAYTLGTNPIVANFIVQSLTYGDMVPSQHIGFDQSFSGNNDKAEFLYDFELGWTVVTGNLGTDYEYNNISSPSNGDLLTIILTSTKALYFKNGTLLATHTDYIPASPIHVGAYVRELNNSVATTVGIDMMSIANYLP